MSVLLLCLVVAISDGDTLTARCGQPSAYEQVKVRLAEIDAPEKAQPFGNRSRQSLADLCHQQQAEIHVVKRDRYGRSVARVSCQGQDASAHQVSTGMAWAFTKYLTDPRIAEQEGKARVLRAGLWRDEEQVPPWEWRSGVRASNYQQ
jgi:endonuclease YncB( thermonuclease family)